MIEEILITQAFLFTAQTANVTTEQMSAVRQLATYTPVVCILLLQFSL